MGWYDCFDFGRMKFTQPDTKIHEIWRVLRQGGRFVCCSWEAQEDLAWMEEAMLRHYPALLENSEYLKHRPIGMAYEKIQGYEIIFGEADFRDVEYYMDTAEFVSTDEEEWWREMEQVGWEEIFENIRKTGESELQKIKEAIFKDIQVYKQKDGIHFTKTVFYVSGIK